MKSTLNVQKKRRELADEESKEMALLNKRKFSPGDIVYWCSNDGCGRFSVKFGMVDSQDWGLVFVDMLEPRNRKLINGVPINEFVGEEKFKKLPKGWTYNTKLHTEEYEPPTDEEKNFCSDITNPKILREAFDKGFIVKAKDNFHGEVVDEITNEGYRTRVRYSSDNHISFSFSIMTHRVFLDYESAKREKDKNIAEFERQANLSDYDWSVEQIEKTLDRWIVANGASCEEAEKYRRWLLALDNVEDVETRVVRRKIQWKYFKNSKWNDIEL